MFVEKCVSIIINIYSSSKYKRWMKEALEAMDNQYRADC